MVLQEISSLIKEKKGFLRQTHVLAVVIGLNLIFDKREKGCLTQTAATRDWASGVADSSVPCEKTDKYDLQNIPDDDDERLRSAFYATNYLRAITFIWITNRHLSYIKIHKITQLVKIRWNNSNGENFGSNLAEGQLVINK